MAPRRSALSAAAAKPPRRAEPERPLYVAEPPAQYLARPPAVVDCSLLGAVLFDEPESEAALQRLAYRQLFAPSLLDQEVLNLAVTKVRRGLSGERAGLALAAFAELPLERREPDLALQFALALRYGLSGYDAAYLWLAAELRAPLLTFDRRLADAATRHLQAL